MWAVAEEYSSPRISQAMLSQKNGGGIATVFGKLFYRALLSKAPGNGHYLCNLQNVRKLHAEGVLMVEELRIDQGATETGCRK